LAGTRRAPRLRVLPPRHALALRRLQYPHRRGAGPDRRTAHRGRVGGLLVRPGDPSARAPGAPCEPGYPLGAPEPARRRRSGGPPQRPPAFPPGLLPLAQVELWFAKIDRDVIARGIFTSVKHLARKLMRYIRHYNQAPTPVTWRYADPSCRITTTSPVTVH